MNVLVTGGCGFIGSAFVRLLCGKGLKPIVIDKLTYAGDVNNLVSVKGKYQLYRRDIREKWYFENVFKKQGIDTVVNIAAESSVDKSIKDCTPFIETNIKGVKNLLDISRRNGVKRFIQISTDEVYGENLSQVGFKETTHLSPSNPYAASKAGADLLVKSYVRTYKFPAIIIRPCNNYGFYQHKEKFIPKMIDLISRGEPIPVHGTGEESREWIWVDDCARGIYVVLRKGILGEIYNLGSGEESKNIEIIYTISGEVGKGVHFGEEATRPGLDRRYFLNSAKIRRLGWKPKMTLEKGLLKTIKHYILDKS